MHARNRDNAGRKILSRISRPALWFLIAALATDLAGPAGAAMVRVAVRTSGVSGAGSGAAPGASFAPRKADLRISLAAPLFPPRLPGFGAGPALRRGAPAATTPAGFESSIPRGGISSRDDLSSRETSFQPPSSDPRAASSIGPLNPIFTPAARAETDVGPPTTDSTPRRRDVSKRLSAILQASRKDHRAASAASGIALNTIGRDNFERLIGAQSVSGRGVVHGAGAARGNAALSSRLWPNAAWPEAGEAVRGPSSSAVPAPAPAGTLRKYFLGTGTFKIGMEALGLAVPLLAFDMFGQAKVAAMLMVGWGLSQVAFSSLAGGLLDRRSPSSLLAWAMGLQALTVAALVGLFAVDALFPGIAGFPLANVYTLLTLYSLAGGFMGAADVARQVIPPELAGADEKAIKILDAKVHVAYEVAGVLGALLAGLSIKLFGLIPTLAIHPPFYLLAAFIFSRMRLAAAVSTPREKPGSETPSEGFLARTRRAWTDIRAGAGAVFSKPVFRWSMLALVVPLVTHRLLESLLIPATAKYLIGDKSVSAWIIGASNFGELVGAGILLWALLSPGGENRFRSAFWVRLMALGSLGILALSFTTNLAIILPLIAFRSMAWATSELSLRGKLQNSMPRELRGRAFAFIGAAAFLAILLVSLGVGTLMDYAARITVFYGVDAAIVAVAALMIYAARHIGKDKELK